MPLPLQSLIGIAFLILAAWLCSANRRAIHWRPVLMGLLLHSMACLLFSRVAPARAVLDTCGVAFVKLLSFSAEGSRFLFGELSDPGGKLAFIFAFNVLPILVFFAGLASLAYHFGILQRVVWVFAWVMRRTMRLTGTESLAVAGAVFLGQSEAPLLVRPFIPDMTRSELFCMMTGGLSCLAGSVLGAYVSFLGGSDPAQQSHFATWLILASIMNAPAAVVFAKLLMPESEMPTLPPNLLTIEKGKHGHFINALVMGAIDGMKLAAVIGSVLLVCVSLIALLNYLTQNWIGDWLGVNQAIAAHTGGVFPGLTLQYLFGQMFRPFAWLMGVPWAETLQVGSLLGQKIVVNEFVAYLDLARMKNAHMLSPHAIMISTFALSSFSNFSSVGVCVACMGALAPNQRPILAKIGMRALFCAVLAGLLTGSVSAMWLS